VEKHFADETVLGANVKLAEHLSTSQETAHLEHLPAVQGEISSMLGQTSGVGHEIFVILAQFDARLRGLQRMAALDLTQ
jgi:hypothetical protein